MLYKGHLLLPDEPGPGLRVNLDVAEHHLAVESDDGGLGAWPLEVVNVERLHGDVFALSVAGEDLRFVADDTIAFAYSGLPSIERVTRRPRTRSSFRSMLDRIWNGPGEPTQPSPVEPVSIPEPGLAEETLVSGAEAARILEVVEDAPNPTVDFDDLVAVSESPLAPDADTWASLPVGEDLANAAGCPAIRSDGRRCESPILTSSGYCYPHDPKRAFEDKYKAAQEARAQLRQDATARLNRIYGRLEKAMRQVEKGELDPETATAMAQIARTMCAILDMEPPGERR